MTTMVGCMGNFSQPKLSITDARVTNRGADFDLHIENQGGLDLNLAGIDYSVEYGILPVASGEWTGDKPLPAGGAVDLTLPVRFRSEPVGAGSEITLMGEMHFDDKTNSGDMKLNSAPFNASAPAGK